MEGVKDLRGRIALLLVVSSHIAACGDIEVDGVNILAWSKTVAQPATETESGTLRIGPFPDSIELFLGACMFPGGEAMELAGTQRPLLPGCDWRDDEGEPFDDIAAVRQTFTRMSQRQLAGGAGAMLLGLELFLNHNAEGVPPLSLGLSRNTIPFSRRIERLNCELTGSVEVIVPSLRVRPVEGHWARAADGRAAIRLETELVAPRPVRTQTTLSLGSCGGGSAMATAGAVPVRATIRIDPIDLAIEIVPGAVRGSRNAQLESQVVLDVRGVGVDIEAPTVVPEVRDVIRAALAREIRDRLETTLEARVDAAVAPAMPTLGRLFTGIVDGDHVLCHGPELLTDGDTTAVEYAFARDVETCPAEPLRTRADAVAASGCARIIKRQRATRQLHESLGCRLGAAARVPVERVGATCTQLPPSRLMEQIDRLRAASRRCIAWVDRNETFAANMKAMDDVARTAQCVLRGTHRGHGETDRYVSFASGRSDAALRDIVGKTERDLERCEAHRGFCDAYVQTSNRIAPRVDATCRGPALEVFAGDDETRRNTCMHQGPNKTIDRVERGLARLAACQSAARFCRAVADTTLAMQVESRNYGCGFETKSWTRDAPAIEAWCRSIRPAAVVDELGKRGRKLEACAAKLGLDFGHVSGAAAQLGAAAGELPLEQLAAIGRRAEVRRRAFASDAVTSLLARRKAFSQQLDQGFCKRTELPWGAKVKRCEKKCLGLDKLRELGLTDRDELCTGLDQCVPIPGTARELCPVCGFEVPVRTIEICVKRERNRPIITVNGEQVRPPPVITKAAAVLQARYTERLTALAEVTTQLKTRSREVEQQMAKRYDDALPEARARMKAEAERLVAQNADAIAGEVIGLLMLAANYAYAVGREAAAAETKRALSSERPVDLQRAEATLRENVLAGLRMHGKTAPMTIGQVFATKSIAMNVACVDKRGYIKRQCAEAQLPIVMRDGLFEIGHAVAQNQIDTFVIDPAAHAYAGAVASTAGSATAGLGAASYPLAYASVSTALNAATNVVIERRVRPVYDDRYEAYLGPTTRRFSRRVVRGLPPALFQVRR